MPRRYHSFVVQVEATGDVEPDGAPQLIIRIEHMQSDARAETRSPDELAAFLHSCLWADTQPAAQDLLLEEVVQ